MNSLPDSALRAQLADALRHLQLTLRQFADHLLTQANDAWIWQPPRPGADPFTRPPTNLPQAETLERIAAGIQTIKYDNDQDSHESRIWPGVVAVTPEGIQLADQVNERKAALAQTLKAMEGRTVTTVINEETGEMGERPLREVALEALRFRRLHHWQATRRLEVLRAQPGDDTPPNYIGFMWANSREVRRTSREKLIQEADTVDRLALTSADLEILESLPVGEPLAIVGPGNTSPKANLRWPARPGEKPITKVRVAVLPFVLLGERLPASLRKLPSVPTPKHLRLARTDTEIEPTPLLPEASIYRYLEPFREAKRQSPLRDKKP